MRNKLWAIVAVALVGVLAYALTKPVEVDPREQVERETATLDSTDNSRNSAVDVKYEGGYWYSR